MTIRAFFISSGYWHEIFQLYFLSLLYSIDEYQV
jgi:hypothetical protein